MKSRNLAVVALLGVALPLVTGCEADGSDLGDFMGTKGVNNELKFRCQTFQMVSENGPVVGADPLSFS